jgi:hypothetical protein
MKDEGEGKEGGKQKEGKEDSEGWCPLNKNSGDVTERPQRIEYPIRLILLKSKDLFLFNPCMQFPRRQEKQTPMEVITNSEEPGFPDMCPVD